MSVNELMPVGEFAHEILDGLWPSTGRLSWHSAATGQAHLASLSKGAADCIKDAVNHILEQNGGSWAEGLHGMYSQTAQLTNRRTITNIQRT